MAESKTVVAQEESPSINPWSFVPLLYFMQAIPVALVQEVATIVYKDLGIANNEIARWTSLIAIPWSLQLLLGPLVDLNFTKRKWILGCQLLITAGLAATPFLLNLPQAFPISLGVLFISAIFSALCNIATDGFILIALRREQQSLFAGFMTTFFRLGRLACTGLLLMYVGSLMKIEAAPVSTTQPGTVLQLKSKDGFELTREAQVTINAGVLTNEKGLALYPEIDVPANVRAVKFEADGRVVDADTQQPLGQLTLAIGDGREKLKEAAPSASTNGVTPAETKAAKSRTAAWTAALIVLAAVYGIGHFTNRFTIPRAPQDVEKSGGGVETKKTIIQSLLLIGMGVGGYFVASAVVRLSAHALSTMLGGGPDKWAGWSLINPEKWDAANPDKAVFMLGVRTPFTPVVAEVVQLGICIAIVAFAYNAAKRLIIGTETERIYRSYATQSGIFAILAFMLFYRFGEVMVARMSPLFLKDSVTAGGLAIPNDQLGIIKGVIGVLGIIIGGIAGGAMISKLGLKKSFIPIALAMHIPNLLYLYAATQNTQLNMMPVAGFKFLIWNIPSFSGTLAIIDFVDQFGYGFGYAGYMIYLMYVAQRGNYKTAHYAIGTGLGALFITVAGVLSGVVQSNFGYVAFFATVIVCTIPGMLTLFFIPWDEDHKIEKPVVE
jgi:PAT family beta-lactamase induction signal transducer AmpG